MFLSRRFLSDPFASVNLATDEKLVSQSKQASLP